MKDEFPDENHFTKSWMNNRSYLTFYNECYNDVDFLRSWLIGEGGWQKHGEIRYINRFLCTHPEHIHVNLIAYTGWIDVNGKRLTFRNEVRRGIATFWRTEHIAKTLDDLVHLIELPYNYEFREQDLAKYHDFNLRLGDRGISALFIDEPIVTIACAIDYQEFLILSQIEKKVFHEMLEEVTNRILTVLEATLGNKKLDTIAYLGGCENAVPPSMGPDAFDEFVVPYSGRIIKRLKEFGYPVLVHCHGHVKSSLEKFVAMGVDALHPLEPPSQGDVTCREARAIVGNNLTIVGNIECNELSNESTEYITQRITELLGTGKQRLIIAESAPPIGKFTQREADNYRVMVKTAIAGGRQ